MTECDSTSSSIVRLVGTNKALEMNLVGDPILAEEAFELGLVNRLVEDHELLDTALAWARKLAQAPPLALEQIKRVSAAGDLAGGIEAEKRAFAEVFQSVDAKEGIAAFLGKSERQIVHLLWKRQIPAFKLGGRWHMRKSTYAAHIEKLEASTTITAASSRTSACSLIL